MLQQSMQLTGVKLTDEQAACWLESIGQIDESDIGAVTAAAEACGVDLP